MSSARLTPSTAGCGGGTPRRVCGRTGNLSRAKGPDSWSAQPPTNTTATAAVNTSTHLMMLAEPAFCHVTGRAAAGPAPFRRPVHCYNHHHHITTPHRVAFRCNILPCHTDRRGASLGGEGERVLCNQPSTHGWRRRALTPLPARTEPKLPHAIFQDRPPPLSPMQTQKRMPEALSLWCSLPFQTGRAQTGRPVTPRTAPGPGGAPRARCAPRRPGSTAPCAAPARPPPPGSGRCGRGPGR